MTSYAVQYNIGMDEETSIKAVIPAEQVAKLIKREKAADASLFFRSS